MADRPALIHVLYAEDNASDADLTVSHFLAAAPDFEIEVVRTGEECLARLRDNVHDVLLLDNHLPDMDGVDVLRQLTDVRSHVPVVVTTAVGDENVAVQVLRLGAADYVPKHGEYLSMLPDVLRHAAAAANTKTRGVADLWSSLTG